MVRVTNLLQGLFMLDQEERFLYPFLDLHLLNDAYFFVIAPCHFLFLVSLFLPCHIPDLSSFILKVWNMKF